jgi:hypothetical protein
MSESLCWTEKVSKVTAQQKNASATVFADVGQCSPQELSTVGVVTLLVIDKIRRFVHC